MFLTLQMNFHPSVLCADHWFVGTGTHSDCENVKPNMGETLASSVASASARQVIFNGNPSVTSSTYSVISYRSSQHLQASLISQLSLFPFLSLSLSVFAPCKESHLQSRNMCAFRSQGVHISPRALAHTQRPAGVLH